MTYEPGVLDPRVGYNPARRCYELYVFLRPRPGFGDAIARSLTFVEHELGATPEPTQDLTQAEAQQLLDQLWAAGLRPSEAKPNDAAFAAQAAHLEDMRQLTFDAAKQVKMMLAREIRLMDGEQE